MPATEQPHPVRRIWKTLTEPSPAITDAQQRRNARLLAIVLVCVIPMMIWGGLTARTGNDSGRDWISQSYLIASIALIITYGLSRTVYYRFGAALCIIAVSVILLVQTNILGTSDPDRIAYSLMWFVAMVLAGTIFLSVWLSITLMVIFLAIILAIGLIYPEVAYADTQFAFIYVLVMSTAWIAVAAQRQRDMRMIEAQARELAEGEDRYRTLFEASFEPLFIHEKGTVVDVNPAFLEVLGYSYSEVVGQSMLMITPPEVHATILEKSRSGQPQVYETTGIRKDGTTFDAEVHSKDIIYQERSMRVVAFRDLTERKRAEAKRLQVNIEGERSKLLRQFVSNASHDLRTPLTTMTTSVYLLRKTAGDPEKTPRYLDKLEGQIEHLTKLLDDLFIMARLDDTARYMERGPLDVNALMGDILQEQKPNADAKGQTIHYEASEDLPIIQADTAELHRAITRIVDNAITYTPEGGQITLSAKRENQCISIDVQDTGIGIPADDLPHIFDRFYRADVSRRTEMGGVGLGLAIAKRIIEMHGGTIEVESTLDVGSTFRVRLPLVVQSAA